MLAHHNLIQVYRRDSKFAKSFLMHLKNGLQSERVRMSQVECEAVVQSYAECYLFLTTALELNAEEQRTWYEEAAAMVCVTNACWYFSIYMYKCDDG